MLSGTVKSYNPHKGWGFVECNGQDSFLYKKELKGMCPSKGNPVKFDIGQSEKGTTAVNVTVIVPEEQASYFGEIKSFNPTKGYGFITCEAFPGTDVFVLKSELPGGFGPEGGHCKFKVYKEAKGPAAKDVMLLGAAGNQVQQMKQSMPWGFDGGKGWGKGDMWGMGGKGGYDMPWGMGPMMPMGGFGMKGMGGYGKGFGGYGGKGW
mmetsp:Transcript_17176/g.30113  ORF Transcript_17176/g.30113 Transcript_17176/m.30113 type:complete len:207 (+) Transcript_17176:65-685(+)